MDYRDKYDKLNTKATKELIKQIKNINGVRFEKEQPTGFYFKTSFGEVYFECEVCYIDKEEEAAQKRKIKEA